MMSLSLWAMALIVSISAVSVVGQGLPMCGCEHRYGVLMEFYHSTNGPFWGNPSSPPVNGWNTLLSCSQPWTGVFCNRSDILTINLSNLNVSGTFPAMLANLTALLELDISHNHITGTLPSLTSLMFVQLTKLFASDNSITGTLPPDWKALKNLELLNLGSNSITGTLPPEWSQMQSLQSLTVSSNELTGTLPANWSQLSTLQQVSLQVNKLTGTPPPEWGSLNLTVVVLSSNNLSGTLPVAWKALVNLNIMQISNNQLSGTLPREYSSLSRISTLDLSKNSFEGTLHSSWSNMSLVQSLVVSSNQLSGSLPPAWAAFTQLGRLDLSNNQFSGTLPEKWAEMGGAIPQYSSIPQLSLILSSNTLQGTLPVSWSNLSKISLLSISSNKLIGTLPASWLQLTTLRTLELNNNRLSGRIPLDSNTSSSLTLLNVSSNCFTGTLNRTVRTTLTIDVCNTHVSDGSVFSACASRLPQRWPPGCNSETASLQPVLLLSTDTATLSNVSRSASHGISPSWDLKASISATVMFLHDSSSLLPSLAVAASSPIAATAVISAVSGVDSGSAQALLTILDSACSCTSPTRSLPRQRQGVQYQEVEQRSSVPRAASLALSPLVLLGDSVGPFEVVVGNVALSVGALLVHCSVAVAHHLLCTDDDESQMAELNDDASAQPKPSTYDLSVLSVHRLACSPSGALFRFPSATLRFTAFLVAGIVWGVTQLLSSPGFFTGNGAEEGNISDDLFEDAQGFDTITVLLGTCISIVFLMGLGAALYVVVLQSWILDGAQGLQFEPFGDVRGNTNPFSPPFPPRAASVLCSRGGQWGPIPRRTAFGSPIATPFMPWCLQWAWAIGPSTSLIAVALSTAHPPLRHRTRACDGIQAVLIFLYIVTAVVFGKLLPHRSMMRSLLAAFSNALNGAVVVLSLLCRYELVGRDSPFIVASAGGYMSLCGSVLMFVVDRLEQRVLQGQRGEQAASSANSRRQSQHPHSRIDIRAYPAELHDDVLRLQQLAALQRLIELAANVTDLGQ